MQVLVNVIKEDIGCGKPRNHRHCAIAGAFKRLEEQMRILMICILAPAAVVFAQDKPATVASIQDKPAAAASAQDNPLSGFNKRAYGQLKIWLLSSAEKMPEENYNFKPTESVRSFGQILGHVADAQYLFCSVVLGEKNPALNIEKTKTSKADLIAALKEAFAYGEKAYDGMTDASAPQMVKFFGGDTPKLSVLTVNIAHTAEHYGNLVTYLRLKNIVPPSSESPAMAPPKK